jgi:hypothetical protein
MYWWSSTVAPYAAELLYQEDTSEQNLDYFVGFLMVTSNLQNTIGY